MVRASWLQSRDFFFTSDRAIMLDESVLRARRLGSMEFRCPRSRCIRKWRLDFMEVL